MKIREIMTTNVTTAELSTTLEEIATIMRHEDVGAVPIIDDNELVGIVTDRDIVVRCVAEGCDPGESIAEDFLTEGLITVSPENDVNEAADLMSRHQIRRLPVVRDGQLAGMVSLGDIAVKQHNPRTSGDTLEEVSEGVKRGSQRQAPRSQRTRHDEQGVANRSADEEKKRQQRVIPINPSERASGAQRNPRKKIG